MKVLHIASFMGNIGDNANHIGMRCQLEKHFPGDHSFTELEIRKCYRIYTGDDRWSFDSEFSRLANQHDLVIIGGGNFFEPWLAESSTGTTIDLSENCLNHFETPLIFYGVGFDTYKPSHPDCLDRFSQFLETLSARENTWVSFRNDGSYQNFIEAYGAKPTGVSIVPDGAFFYPFDNSQTPCLPLQEDKQYWAVNIASDMLEQRFPNGNSAQEWQGFLQVLADFLSLHLTNRPNLNIILMPHMFRDVHAAGELMMALDDRFNRSRVMVAPYVFGNDGARMIFSLYQRFELTFSMRFHSAICSMAAGTPVVPMTSTAKLKDLFNELAYGNVVVNVNDNELSKNLGNQVTAALEQASQADSLKNLRQRMLDQSDLFWMTVTRHWPAQS